MVWGVRKPSTGRETKDAMEKLTRNGWKKATNLHERSSAKGLIPLTGLKNAVEPRPLLSWLVVSRRSSPFAATKLCIPSGKRVGSLGCVVGGGRFGTEYQVSVHVKRQGPIIAIEGSPHNHRDRSFMERTTCLNLNNYFSPSMSMMSLSSSFSSLI